MAIKKIKLQFWASSYLIWTLFWYIFFLLRFYRRKIYRAQESIELRCLRQPIQRCRYQISIFLQCKLLVFTMVFSSHSLFYDNFFSSFGQKRFSQHKIHSWQIDEDKGNFMNGEKSYFLPFFISIENFTAAEGCIYMPDTKFIHKKYCFNCMFKTASPLD